MEDKIRVYQLQVGQPGFIEEIDNTLESFQNKVDGYIEIVSLDRGCELDLVCNDEGKNEGRALNRAWLIDDKISDIIVGDCFITRHDSDGNSCSILESDIPKINSILKKIVGFADGIFILEEDKEDGEVRE